MWAARCAAGFLGGNYAYGYNGNEIFESFFGTSNPFASIVEGAQSVHQLTRPVANHHKLTADVTLTRVLQLQRPST